MEAFGFREVSDPNFDNLLLNHYLELEVEIGKLIEETRNESTARNIEFFINELQSKIANNDRIIRELEIVLEDREYKDRQFDIRWRNDLIAINDKTRCLIKYLSFYLDNPAFKKIDTSLIAFKYHDAFKNICKKCDVSLAVEKFNAQQYAALFYIIYEGHKEFFKKDYPFTKVQRMFDNYFNRDTLVYKPNKLVKEIESLKYNYSWINTL